MLNLWPHLGQLGNRECEWDSIFNHTYLCAKHHVCFAKCKDIWSVVLRVILEVNTVNRKDRIRDKSKKGVSFLNEMTF